MVPEHLPFAVWTYIARLSLFRRKHTMLSTSHFHSPLIVWGTCLSLALGVAVSVAQAEVVTIDVIVQAVDAKERSITVSKATKTKSKDLELEVGKKAKVTIGGRDATFDLVKPGQKASLSYETELEVVTKVDITGNTGTTPSPTLVKPTAAPSEGDGFELLLPPDGLEGWYFLQELGERKPNWENKNGTLVYKSPGTSLISDRKFSDFEMQLEFKLPKDCNCGVFLRGRYEIKLTDTLKGSTTSLRPEQRIGAIFKRIVPTKNPYKGANQWNKLDVKLVGTRVTVKINGENVIDDTEIVGGPTATFLGLEQDESLPGPIMFFAHQKGVGAMFRNLKLRVLED
jgi:hypothetical protein